MGDQAAELLTLLVGMTFPPVCGIGVLAVLGWALLSAGKATAEDLSEAADSDKHPVQRGCGLGTGILWLLITLMILAAMAQPFMMNGN